MVDNIQMIIMIIIIMIKMRNVHTKTSSLMDKVNYAKRIEVVEKEKAEEEKEKSAEEENTSEAEEIISILISEEQVEDLYQEITIMLEEIIAEAVEEISTIPMGKDLKLICVVGITAAI